MKFYNKRKLALLAALALALTAAGCSGAADGEEPGASEQPSQESPSQETPSQESPTEQTPEAEQPAEEQSEAALGVEKGASKTIDTEIEGMSEQVNVTEYTLTPYNIQFVLRTDMGEPTVEDGKVVYKTQMGDDVATISFEVKEGMTMDDAVAEAQQAYADGYEAQEPADIGTDLNGYSGKIQGFQKEDYFYGFHVFSVNDNALVIHHSYPAEAGDGMGAVMHEMLQSIR
ncbi:hypothetical protein [Paenibacillus sp.]|uniref:hypothetical protein n=1 Tax=Paenibacillus sp. TaxID=58172 RepID=UPI002D395A4A|nr:hypothetical protein [Paenibacillus sp.]HZG85729.1 hypothetical protein [Paenibacillus sp.]